MEKIDNLGMYAKRLYKSKVFNTQKTGIFYEARKDWFQTYGIPVSSTTKQIITAGSSATGEGNRKKHLEACTTTPKKIGTVIHFVGYNQANCIQILS